jgi:hypothetical protein
VAVTYRIWYCRRCRRALKAEVPGMRNRACRCKVPMLPKGPTIVHLVGPS